jgi:steroid-24-oyl-CoA synthetase
VKPGADVSDEELKRHVAARLAAFKVPVRIELGREPCRATPTEKSLKRELRAVFA